MAQTSTIKQLAQILNMSISTVSRALKNHPDIAEKTKQKVRELAPPLEYEPNAYATQLRTNVRNVLGILIPTITNFFYDTFIASVADEARKAGYSLLIMQSGESSELELNFDECIIVLLHKSKTVEEKSDIGTVCCSY
jgi:LacI family transcriptional regulator